VKKIDDNTSLPVTISSVRILHANRTRRSFLERVVNPILSANRDEPYTLEEALKEVGDATDKLNRFGRTARDRAPRMGFNTG
jgi:outer membrane protein insertion porin family